MTDIAAGQGKSGGGGRSAPAGKAGTRKTAAGGVAVAERETAKQAGGFYGGAMYLVQVSDWPADKLTPEQPVQSSGAARLLVAAADPQDSTIPVVLPDAALFATTTFSLMNSGNRTLRAPKRSWKARFDGPGDALGGQATLNLKAMYNDPSQMREALAWRYLAAAGIPAARHTYAKLTINGGYRGLFSLIEQVDKRFLKDHYGKNDKGNLYKAYCGDIGCATLEHRVGANGDDSGRQYFSGKPDDRAYRLKTNEDESAANTYDDLAALTRAIDGVGLPGGDARFGTDAFRTSLESILNVKAFLRWAATNVLLGSWDNYFATPAELLPLQLGPQRRSRRLHEYAVLHLHPVGLRQQLRDRLLRDAVAVHRPPRSRRQYSRLLAGQQLANAPFTHPARTEPAAQPRSVPVLPRLRRAHGEHVVHPGCHRHRDRPRRHRRAVGPGFEGCLRRVGHTVRGRVHRTAIHQ